MVDLLVNNVTLRPRRDARSKCVIASTHYG